MSLSLQEAQTLAKLMEPETSLFGWHIALTGGVLYKESPRKDTDFIVYEDQPGKTTIKNIPHLAALLLAKGIQVTSFPIRNTYPRFVVNARYNKSDIDLIFITNEPAIKL